VHSSVVEHAFARAPGPAPVAEASESAFRQAMRGLASGVCVVTFGAGSNGKGFTATSVTSLSSDPPSLIACLHRGSSSYDAVRRSPAFAVNLLSADQQEFAERFAGGSALQGPERYQGSSWRPLPSGVLCLANSVAAFDCEVEDMIERHTHAILIGRVRHVYMGTGSGALVYWRGGYDQVGWSGEQIARATGLSPIRFRSRKRAP
jgi:flavin reductase (DIM6/NTAB) family NADH-FMN oxidoreductase RutF